MPLLKPKEFAMAVGVPYNTLRQHISRGKVFKSGDYINTDFAPNKEYISEQTDGKGYDLDKLQSEKKDNVSIKGQKAAVKLPQPEIQQPKETNGIYSRKRFADVLKTEKEIELKNLQIEKIRGELMPVEMVQKIMVINIQSVFREFESGCENIASVYCEILGGNRDHLARMVKEMRQVLEDSIKNAKDKSKVEIQTIIKDYAVTRSRGQRK
ncbi:hypothetical protein MWU78_21405 [Arenibacter sp. F26102]|uniref:hypothetical protein n=1 Tax=Arenibacter sp. F26102 TaxID=2926416 RepID=UPI001FF0DFF5|nr:hypothetical protein [Arenibacter sp. F26102]MCK0148218.1 hypothetical protein [Arenibacter sp. F26102]